MRNRGRRGGSGGGGGNNRWATIMQILVLVGALIFIFVFRDDIAQSASNILGGFDDKGDIEVQQKKKD